MPTKPRPYIGMLFKCCNVYTRVYLNKGGTAYTGFCPKCAKKSVVKVGSGGKKIRFWTAG